MTWFSFEPDKIDVFLDGKQLGLEPGQTVIAHGLDRGLQPDEIRTATILASTAREDSSDQRTGRNSL